MFQVTRRSPLWPVARFGLIPVTPFFAELAAVGRGLGFAHVESGPLVRSSYHAKKQTEAMTPA